MSDSKSSGETNLQPVEVPDPEPEIRVLRFAQDLIIDQLRLPAAELVLTDTMKRIVQEAVRRQGERFQQEVWEALNGIRYTGHLRPRR